MEVAKKKISRSTTFIGKLDSPQNVEVRARVESFVDKILFTEGGGVKEGDLLFELNKKPFEEKLAAAKGAAAEAKAALEKTQHDVARLTPLAAQNAVPRKDLDAAVSATEMNEANLASAEARVKSAEIDLGYCDVKAPITGRIGAKEVTIGSLVGKGAPTLLATISQTDLIWFSCYISEVDFLTAERLANEAGRKMGELPVHLILTDGTEHPETGKWIFLDRMVEATTGTIRARAEFPNTRGVLRPGMFARVRVSLPTEEGNILVPERALTEIQGKNFLWIVNADNKASQRAVEVAPTRIGPDVVVLKGLEPGEHVVVEGVQKLREGAPVQPKMVEETAPPPDNSQGKDSETKPAPTARK